jgi:predicted nucleic acid-binding protein
MRVLLDSNVVLDFILKRRDFFAEANEIFVRMQNLEFEGFVSPITPINAFYTAKKEIGLATAFASVENLLEVVEICRSDKQTLKNAFSLDFKDYEDAVQCASAIAEGLDAIVTRNTRDFTNSPIEVYPPADFLAHLHPTDASKQ